MANQLIVTDLHALPWWILLIPLISLAAAILKLPQVKGRMGEMLLHQCLRIGLDRTRYRIFRNLILPTADGTTQIDHVLVSRHGIFVIETKNYAGWIFGREYDKTWTQKFYRRSYSFQNPLRQNYKHVRALAELTGVDEPALFSLIVFVGDSTFKTPMPDQVTRISGCLAYVRARKAMRLSEAEVDAVIASIEQGRIAPSRAANTAHVRHVQALVAQRNGGAGTAVPIAPGKAPPAPAPARPSAAASASPTAATASIYQQ